MYTALIVDNEEELRRAIIEKVDWQESGFTVIGDAGNGIDALELAERLEPDPDTHRYPYADDDRS